GCGSCVLETGTKNPEIPVELDNLIVRLMAKDPAQRPWDAVAVGHALTELRDKALRGDPIPMVFTAVDAPTRAELTTPGGSSLAGATRSGVRTKGGKAGRKGRGRLLSRRTLETAGLAAALVGVSALLAYLLWPPSAAYQFRKAEELMASSDPTRWAIAKDQYIDDLRRRFPDYRPQEVQAWLDRIALNRAERRAYVLEHPSVLASSQPKTDAEDLYVRTYKHVEEAEKIGLDVDALRLWSDMARVLQEHHPEDRGWILLAQQKAEAVRKTLESRRAAVLQALRLAVAADRAGRTEEALRLRRDVLKQYGQYPELADLIRPLRLLLPLEEEEKAAPEKSETEAEAKAKEAAQPPGPGEAPTP
ncbi:MAG: hypothetical protein IRY99_23950, partial [Isosphaeraceae bacterium]|nr:hypothetical protein [Isosphaeraceae bacterium]